MRQMLVVYYSSYGHIETMAYAQADGAAKVPGTQVVVKRVAELAPPDVCKNAGFKLDQAAPLATRRAGAVRRGDLRYADALGNMAAQMRNYLDQTGLWHAGRW
jgi:NAD(P)H dehydrogenase (quinone)